MVISLRRWYILVFFMINHILVLSFLLCPSLTPSQHLYSKVQRKKQQPFFLSSESYENDLYRSITTLPLHQLHVKLMENNVQYNKLLSKHDLQKILYNELLCKEYDENQKKISIESKERGGGKVEMEILNRIDMERMQQRDDKHRAREEKAIYLQTAKSLSYDRLLKILVKNRMIIFDVNNYNAIVNISAQRRRLNDKEDKDQLFPTYQESKFNDHQQSQKEVSYLNRDSRIKTYDESSIIRTRSQLNEIFVELMHEYYTSALYYKKSKGISNKEGRNKSELKKITRIKNGDTQAKKAGLGKERENLNTIENENEDENKFKENDSHHTDSNRLTIPSKSKENIVLAEEARGKLRDLFEESSQNVEQKEQNKQRNITKSNPAKRFSSKEKHMVEKRNRRQGILQEQKLQRLRQKQKVPLDFYEPMKEPLTGDINMRRYNRLSDVEYSIEFASEVGAKLILDTIRGVRGLAIDIIDVLCGVDDTFTQPFQEVGIDRRRKRGISSPDSWEAFYSQEDRNGIALKDNKDSIWSSYKDPTHKKYNSQRQEKNIENDRERIIQDHYYINKRKENFKRKMSPLATRQISLQGRQRQRKSKSKDFISPFTVNRSLFDQASKLRQYVPLFSSKSNIYPSSRRIIGPSRMFSLFIRATLNSIIVALLGIGKWAGDGIFTAPQTILVIMLWTISTKGGIRMALLSLIIVRLLSATLRAISEDGIKYNRRRPFQEDERIESWDELLFDSDNEHNNNDSNDYSYQKNNSPYLTGNVANRRLEKRYRPNLKDNNSWVKLGQRQKTLSLEDDANIASRKSKKQQQTPKAVQDVNHSLKKDYQTESPNPKTKGRREPSEGRKRISQGDANQFNGWAAGGKDVNFNKIQLLSNNIRIFD